MAEGTKESHFEEHIVKIPYKDSSATNFLNIQRKTIPVMTKNYALYQKTLLAFIKDTQLRKSMSALHCSIWCANTDLKIVQRVVR
jgi:hypothetical protein